MSFDTPGYVLFLGVAAVLCRLCPKRLRWALLLPLSLFFYACWSPPLTLVILGVILVTYGCGLGLGKTESALGRKIWLLAAAAACMGLLVWFKYFNFLLGSVSALLGKPWTPWQILLPVGCSFYTFQALSYVIDVYRRRLSPVRHMGHYALYIAFFPQLVAGPIERAETLLPQLIAPPDVKRKNVRQGLLLLICGFFRKLVIADLAAPAVDRVFLSACPDGSTVALGLVLFSFQIYCDFSGYTDIARGSALLMGVHLRENFDRPYLARTLRDFWRRWHMSLTGWFTDYVYIPLGGSRKGKGRQILAVLTVFLLSGLWHGADWTFVCWGLWHGLICAGEILWRRKREAEGPLSVRKAVSWLGVYGAVTASWLLFRSESLSQAYAFALRLFSPWHLAEGWKLLSMSGFRAACIALALCQLPLLYRLPWEEGKEKNVWSAVLLAACALAAWFLRAADNGASAFIYFQF